MPRLSFVLRLKPQADPQEYERRHEEIWPEMLVALRKAGISNYSIYLADRLLFSYMEADDPERTVQALANDPVVRRWQRYMAPMLEADPRNGFPELLPEMFHMD